MRRSKFRSPPVFGLGGIFRRDSSCTALRASRAWRLIQVSYADSSPFRGAFDFRTAARAYKQRGFVCHHRPPTAAATRSPQQCISYSEAASGLLTGSQGTDARANLSGSRYSVRLQPRRRMQGWVLRAGGPPPALSGVFLPRFFLRWRRKNRAPGGR